MKSLLPAGFVLCMACHSSPEDNGDPVRLITLDPGHFHAALVQKSMPGNIDPVVHVYAPPGPDVQLHLSRIKAFNSRKENPTHWNEKVFIGDGFMEKMLEERAGNVVVLAGNNREKTGYILKSVEAGFHVLADKPMAIDRERFSQLKSAFEIAKVKGVVLYDIMTERFEITSILQRELSRLPEVFGTLEKGTPDDPAVIEEGTHYFYKNVSGSALTRPPWFLDVAQEGDGITDVTTHLVDLVQWECFPEQSIDYETQIQVLGATHWTTDLTLPEFQSLTKLASFPDYLNPVMTWDSVLKIFCNGEINYKLRGVHARVSVVWGYQAPEGGGDTHFSMIRGSKANLVIRQGAEQHYQPTLYIELTHEEKSSKTLIMNELYKIKDKFPGVGLMRNSHGWEVIIPEKYKESHEAHFARVMQNFLVYVRQGNIPDWEVPNMLAKYYTTTTALELAKEHK